MQKTSGSPDIKYEQPITITHRTSRQGHGLNGIGYVQSNQNILIFLVTRHSGLCF